MVRRTLSVLFASVMLLGGCAQFDKVPAKYGDLKQQKTGIMVWATQPVKLNFSSVQLDIAKGVQHKLEQATAEAPELKGISFPVRADSIARYQQNYPQIQAMPIEKVAPKLGGVTRLIYIEIDDLGTRVGNAALNLYRGRISGNLKVIEITDGVGKVAYEENNIIATYPKEAPEAGTPNLDDYRAYRGAVDAFTTEVAVRFFAHYAN